jgi:transposase
MRRFPYAPEFIEEAVRLVREGGKKRVDVAHDLGVSAESIRRWMKQYEVDAGRREGLTTAERDKLQRLQREVRVLTEEREILKKAAAFFAREANRSR